MAVVVLDADAIWVGKAGVPHVLQLRVRFQVPVARLLLYPIPLAQAIHIARLAPSVCEYNQVTT